MKKQILEMLTGKFPGMRKDGLQTIAMSLSLIAADEESAQKLVGDLTAERVEEIIKDYRTTADQEIAKAIETYKKSHTNPKQPTPPAQTPTQEPPAPEAMTAEAIAKIVSENLASALKPITDRMASLEGNAISATRLSLVESELNDLPDSFRSVIIDGFKGRNFENDEDFNKYLETTKSQVASFRKDVKNSGIRTFGNSTKPQQGGGADDTDPAVELYLAAKKKDAEDFGGKQL